MTSFPRACIPLVLSASLAAQPEPAADAESAAEAAPGRAWDVLAVAGDTVLARWEHDFVARRRCEWPLARVAPVLASADAALANLECAVATRGSPAEKGERCPFYYRARPEMLGVLLSAGIGIVTAANNHVGDYGPEGVAETDAWTRAAGLVATGIGRDPEDAARPRLVRAGRTLLAVAGLDMTSPRFAAAPGRWGSHYADPNDLEGFARAMEALAASARGTCDLLVLAVHWGANWVREVPEEHRKLARIALEAGVDIVAGHSAHRLQGIEVVGGKVVLYDVGNLLFDCELREDGRRSAIFRLALSRRGVARVEAIPIEVREGHTELASGAEALATLEELRRLSLSLGTEVRISRGASDAPIAIVEVADPRATPRSPVAEGLESASLPRAAAFPSPRAESAIVPALPEVAARFEPPAELAPGIELLGASLPDEAPEGGILTVATWWRLRREVSEPWLVALELAAGGTGPEGSRNLERRGTSWYTRHDPGDWLLPFARLRPGEIVEDRHPARLEGLPAGLCEVRALVLDPRKPEPERALGPAKALGAVTILPRAMRTEGPEK